jgi:hypothetical protein
VIHRRRTYQTTRILRVFGFLALAGLTSLAGCHTFDANEEPTDEDVTIITITPAQLSDTTFVGDIVVTRMPAMFDNNCQNVQVSCLGLDGVPVTWATSNNTIVAPYDLPTEIFQFNDYKVSALGAGEATVSFGPYSGASGVRRVFPFAPGITYQHKYVVLPSAPNRLDAPDVVVLGVGDSTLIFAEPRVGNTPGFITTFDLQH